MPSAALAVLISASFWGEETQIGMEATGAYSMTLAEFLAEQGYVINVINLTRIHAFTKTDRADAKLIAQFVQEKRHTLWTPPPRNIRELQNLLRRFEHQLEFSCNYLIHIS